VALHEGDARTVRGEQVAADQNDALRGPGRRRRECQKQSE
jgi:hypothetical protein